MKVGSNKEQVFHLFFQRVGSMRDARVQLIFVMSFLYLMGSVFGDRFSALIESPDSTAHLHFVSLNQLVVEAGPGQNLQETVQCPPAVHSPFFFQAVPINSAEKEMLMTVKGIGPALAESIIACRQTTGPFKSVEDLTRIPGVGIKRATTLAAFLLFDEVP